MKRIILLPIMLLLFFVACKNSQKSTATEQAAKQSETAKQESKTYRAYDSKAEPAVDSSTDEVSVSDEAQETQEEERMSNAEKQDQDRLKPQMAEDSFFKMIKTPCFGRCPVYNFEVKQNGFAILEGIQNFDYKGMYEAQFSETQLNKITALAEEYGYLEMDHVYDAAVTDLPSTTTALRTREGVHWVYNRMSAPQALNDFQTEIETLLKDVQWQPADQTTD